MADLPVPEDRRPAAGDARGFGERVSDADRDRTVTVLREHVVDGRLTLDEFSERMGRALQLHAPEATSTQSWPTSPRPGPGCLSRARLPARAGAGMLPS